MNQSLYIAAGSTSSPTASFTQFPHWSFVFHVVSYQILLVHPISSLTKEEIHAAPPIFQVSVQQEDQGHRVNWK